MHSSLGSVQSNVTIVEQARTARVGSRVSLTGSLKKEVRRAQYLFRDATGDIRVRIERKFWRGPEVTSTTVLQLRGKVETDVRGRFVDVYYFRILD
ncbi:NirD/YgiW/YdeI family stress tolerance protein [Mesorhizobium sp. YM1C-6-2]|nr:NirD/YgiW/YdeI family stress tolerance protein [Mesorhizobium sp. YM1C-6-2]